MFLAVEVAQPFDTIGLSAISDYITTPFLNGIQFATMLHFTCIIPQKQQWLNRRTWVFPAFYFFGISWGAVMAAINLVNAVWERDWLARGYTFFNRYIVSAWFLVWVTLAIVFLAISALRQNTERGRRQALVVLLGLAPWAAFTSYIMIIDLLGSEGPVWLYTSWCWRLTLVPLSISCLLLLLGFFRSPFSGSRRSRGGRYKSARSECSARSTSLGL